MTPERWQRCRELFEAAAKLNPTQADAHLRAECAGDSALLAEIRAMLEEQRRTGTLDHNIWQSMRDPAGSPPVFSAGQVVAERYRILRYLSRGGMGEVYEAQHLLLPDRVALKTLLPAIASDEAMIARFKQEIQLARKIAHPNVCKVFDLECHRAEGSVQSAVYFLTMEFLAGETLSSRIRRQGRLSAAEALPLVEQMAEALEAAHRSGVIHRDFKPSNVMLAPSGGSIRAVVTDFGLARGIATGDQSTDTVSKNVAGTLDYMAPELLTGSIASCRSDIYAFGVVAYQMLTGELPFAGETPLAAAFLRARKPVPSPRTLAPDLDPKWEQAILRALDADPGRRFSTVSEFPRALRGEKVSVTLPLPALTRRKVLASGVVAAGAAAAWMGWRNWSGKRRLPAAEAARLYQQGVDDIHAGAYFAATKALGQAVELAPAYSPARARLAESWVELDLPEKAAFEFLPVGRQDNSWLPRLDRLQIEAVDLTLTREFPAAVARYEEMGKLAGSSADLDVDLGRAYEKAGQTGKAIDAYRRAAEGPWHSAAAWLRLGVLYSRGKKTAESEAAFAQADQRYRQISNLEGTIELTLQRGVAANRSNRYADAAGLLRKAMEQAHDAGNLQQEIKAKLTLANVSYKAGDTDQAQTLAREALAAAQANQMESLTVRGFLNLGGAYFGKGDYTGAEEYFHNALTLAQRTGSSLLAAQSQLNLASVHDQLNRSEDEIREARAALAYYQPNRWAQETFQALTLIGRGEKHRGNYAAAGDSFQRLLDESTKAQDRANIASAQEGLGDVLSATDDYPKALEHYRGYLAASGDASSTGYAARDCAMALMNLGRYDEAAADFAKADAAAKAVPVLRPSLALCRADMALSRNRFPEAIGGARAALSAAAGLNPLMAVTLTRILGLALLRSTDRKAGLQKCEEAYNAALKLGDPGAVLDTGVAFLEGLLAARDSARAAGMFHDLEPALAAHPESRWRALALMARSDRQYADRAKEAAGQLETLWGHDAILPYSKRPDLQELWPLVQSNSAKH